MSDPAELLHVKALSTGGAGMTSWIMSAMERAASYGARVVSMSLGGEQQGPVTEDPYSKVMALTRDRVIWVIAAGNSGPDGWTIGSPGVSPYAITVGAWSPLHNGLAIFSSRGPSGAWYRDHPQDWERDLADFGEDLIKPDLVSPGGGPVEEGQAQDQLYSAVTGWYDGMVDLVPNGWDAMRGTSQATPHAAGLLALAIDRGLIATADDVKRMIRPGLEIAKSPETGYGFLVWPIQSV